MSKKPQTRITVSARGTQSLLLSIAQNANGSLYVKPATADTVILPSGRYGVKDERYSIHRSDAGDAIGSTFHYHLVTENGPRTDGYLFTTAIRNGRVAFLYAQLFRDLATKPVAVPSRDRDIGINLPGYNSKFASLIMTVFVGPPGEAGGITPSERFTTERIQFDHFSIILAYAYSRQPSGNEGRTLHLATGLSRNGERSPHLLGQPDDGYNPAQATGFAEAYLMMLHDARTSMRWNDAGGSPILQRIVHASAARGFGPAPV